MTSKPGAFSGFLAAATVALLSSRACAIPVILKTGTFDPARATVRLQSLPSDAYYLVQFSSAPGAVERRALEDAGAEALGYIPENCYLIQAEPAVLQAVQKLPGIAWSGAYAPEYRISPDVPSTNTPIQVTVTTFPGFSAKKLADQLGASKGAVTRVSDSERGGVLTVQTTGAEAHAWTHISGVRWIEPRITPKLANDVARGIMNVNPVWTDTGRYGQGQIIAVCDTGLDVGAENPSLDLDFRGRVVAAFDLGRNGLTNDPNGHGTHVTGSVLGNGQLSGSNPLTHSYINSYAGVAPEAQLVMQSVLDSSGGLGGLPSDLNELFDQAYQAGARVHTNSWGAATSGAYDTEAGQVDQFVWSQPDMVVLFAAGNEGVDSDGNGVIDPGSVDSPGTAKNCIAVGASESVRSSGGYQFAWATGSWASKYPAEPIKSDLISNDSSGMAAFSSRGPCQDGRIKPDICAPGTNILSVRSHESGATSGWGGFSADYIYMGGTSMATPLTAGAAALVRERYQSVWGIQPSAALVKGTLLVSADDISPGQYGTGAAREIPVRPNSVEGWGRVDAKAAINPDAPAAIQFVDNKQGLQTADIRTFNYSVIDTSVPLRIVLVWSDYPGEPAAGKALVNDLDLQVRSPGGLVYAGNGLVDRLNNVESVDIPAPESGAYTVTVSAWSVPHGPQPFALVVEGGLPKAAISGRALSQSGSGVPDVLMSAVSATNTFTASTGPDGSYEIMVSPDAYSVSASKGGWAFAPASQSVAVPAEGIQGIDFTGTAGSAFINGVVSLGQNQQTSGSWGSIHPYPDNYSSSVTVTGPTAAVRMRLHFAQISTESGYDFVTISDPSGAGATSYSGSLTAFWSPWVDGAAVRVALTSDGSKTGYGWTVDAYEATLPGAPLAGVVVTDSHSGASQTTGVDGAFTFSGLEPLPTTLSAALEGYVTKPNIRPVSPQPGQRLQGQNFVAVPLTPVAHVKLQHTYLGDLLIKVGVGSPASPLWIKTIWNRQVGNGSLLTLDVPLEEGISDFPPSFAQPWFLQVCDQALYDQGTLQEFWVTKGQTSYGSFDVPKSITDGSCLTVYIPAQSPIRIGAAKQLTDGTSCLLVDKAVTAVFPDRIYVEEPDLSSAISVPGVFTFAVGDRVSALGVLGTAGCERTLQNAQVQKNTAGLPALHTLRFACRNVGGYPPSPTSPGFVDSVDLNNIGLLINLSGTVTKTGTGWFYVDDGTAAADGSGFEGIRVISGALDAPSAGSFVSVTGISNCKDSGFGDGRVLYVRTQSDIAILNEAPGGNP